MTDAHGQFVGNLQQKDFRIFDLGEERPIKFFLPVETPARILVLVETSPAVYLIHNEHLLAASALLDGLASEDQLAVATYDQSVKLALPFTTDKPLEGAAFASLEYNLGMGNLNFYDAVSSALDFLNQVSGKKAIVMLTTGLDSSPPGHWEALESKIRAGDVPIFAVGLGSPLRGGEVRQSKKGKASETIQPNTPDQAVASITQPQVPGLSFDRAAEVLREMAQISGGKAYFPVSAKDFATAYREIAVMLRHEYLLGFQPAIRDGHYHAIQVQVLDQNDKPRTSKDMETVFARQGYVAPGP